MSVIEPDGPHEGCFERACECVQEQLRGAVSALEEIAQADPVDMALDPTWAQRIARAELGIRPFDITGRQ